MPPAQSRTKHPRACKTPVVVLCDVSEQDFYELRDHLGIDYTKCSENSRWNCVERLKCGVPRLFPRRGAVGNLQVGDRAGECDEKQETGEDQPPGATPHASERLLVKVGNRAVKRP
eukprot:3615236-Prymnesium_polylepis.1